ncbi:MAG: hypothetical protein KGD64_08940 [Candidatus Heimdallarchaeota archaeon]|nr:hypothetical protein [Candidatus Heimdallarchaeota archaeon]
MKIKRTARNKILLGGVLTILILTSFVVYPVTANNDDNEDDDDDDGVHNEEEEENERDLTVEVSGTEAQIESHQDYGEIQNEISIQMKAENEGLKFELEFDNETEAMETEIEFTVEISEIIEYDDIHDDGYFNESVDTVIQRVELSDFNDIVYAVENISNNLVHHLSIETSDGVFSAGVYISSEFSLINGILLAPTEIKIDIGIHGFNFIEPDSALALKIVLESESGVDYEVDEETEDEEDGRASDEEEVDISLGDYSGFFSWIENVTADGTNYLVNATPVDTSGEENEMYLNYPRGSEIIHDPKIGIAGILQDFVTTLIEGTPWFEIPRVTQVELLIVSGAVLLVLITVVLITRKK